MRKEPRGTWRIRVGKKYLGSEVKSYTKVFSSEKEAVKFCRDLDKKQSGDRATAKKVDITPLQLAEAKMAFERVKNANLGTESLLKAVDMLVTKTEAQNTKTVEMVIDALRVEMDGKVLSPRHPRETEERLRRFFIDHLQDPIGTISYPMILELLKVRDADGALPSPQQKAKRLRYVKMLFNFAVEHQHLPANPIPKSRKNTTPRLSPVPLKPEDVASLLWVCSDQFPPSAPALAIKIFSGVRNPELFGLRWGDVDLVNNEFTVDEAFCKTKRRRAIEIHPTLKTWLEGFRGNATDTDLVFGRHTHVTDRSKVWYDLMRQIQKIGNVTLKQNALRHLFGSYHFALYRNENKTAAQMGNSAPIVKQYYRGVVRKPECTKFWRLTPARVESLCDNSPLPASAPSGVEDTDKYDHH